MDRRDGGWRGNSGDVFPESGKWRRAAPAGVAGGTVLVADHRRAGWWWAEFFASRRRSGCGGGRGGFVHGGRRAVELLLELLVPVARRRGSAIAVRARVGPRSVEAAGAGADRRGRSSHAGAATRTEPNHPPEDPGRSAPRCAGLRVVRAAHR